MNKKIIGFLIFIFVIVGIVAFGYFRATPGVQNQNNLPKIEITPESFDFGEIRYGDIVNYTFRVKNLGNEVLEIKRVATSCACTTAKINKDKINPTEEVELLVSYDTGAMSGSHAKGKQERIIYLKSNDPSHPQVEVMIYANVK